MSSFEDCTSIPALINFLKGVEQTSKWKYNLFIALDNKKAAIFEGGRQELAYELRTNLEELMEHKEKSESTKDVFVAPPS